MFIYCHIGLSLIVSFSSMRKKKKKKKRKKKKRKKKKKKRKKKRKKKEKKKEKKKKIYINKCAHICIQYKYSLSPYVDL